MGMSHDFWQALQGWGNLGLAENSVRWASYEDLSSKEWQAEIKDRMLEKGERRHG
jgi:adenosine deaminase CECR1